MSMRLLILIYVCLPFSVLAVPEKADSLTWSTQFTYYHWQFHSLLKSPEDVRFFEQKIKPGPEGFRMKVKSAGSDSIKFEVMGKTLSLAYSQSSKKFALNGHVLNLSPKSSLAEIHGEFNRVLNPAKNAGLTPLLIPEAQAMSLIALVAPELWAGVGFMGAACWTDRRPGGELPSYKLALHVIGGPISLGWCVFTNLLSNSVDNVDCPASFKQPIAIQLINGTVRLKRDDTGRPTFITVADAENRETLFAKVNEPDSSGKVTLTPIRGKVGEYEKQDIEGAVAQVGLYCVVSSGPDIERLGDFLKGLNTSLPKAGLKEEKAKAKAAK